MLKSLLSKIKNLICHPIFVYSIIVVLSCLKRDDTVDILYEMPKVGDNFRTAEDATVYYFSGIGKYNYTTPDCYFGYGNPPFEVHYSKGGVKVIDNSFADKIPLLGNMCNGAKISTVPKTIVIPTEMYFSQNYLLANFSELAHFGCYLLLAISLLFYLPETSKKYWLTFGLCFFGGAILELVQKFFIYGRQASFEDLAMNSAGALLGMLIYWLWIKKVKKAH